MKQVRKVSEVVFKGTEALVKFGKFPETKGVQTAGTPIAMVVEEHVGPSKSNLSFSFEEPVNEAVISPADIEKEINIFKQSNDPSLEQMEALIEQLQSTTRKPPQEVPVTDESPSGSDKDDSNASLMPRKRRPQVNQVDQSQIVEPAQPAQVNQDAQSRIFNEDFLANEETFASGSSSAPPPPEHDSASVMLVKLLAFQDSIPQSRGKGIYVGSRHGGDEDSQQTIS
ncbi:unnamed protein product [Lactuca virosa]|uniref:Uncharacterized protein n=1 Tax=Lactuca virosa TaxID=75947 RepID=A0AAU9PT39_9ASTR|nr:unnamed protein product [Lactuca virosa]